MGKRGVGVAPHSAIGGASSLGDDSQLFRYITLGIGGLILLLLILLLLLLLLNNDGGDAAPTTTTTFSGGSPQALIPPAR